jgi:hypothetical protein
MTQSGNFKAEASRISKFAVTGHLSDGAMTKISEFSLEGHVSIVS